MTNTFKFHTDGGHGWLQVNSADLASLGLGTNDFSHYSYVDHADQGIETRYYLEEDQDVIVFFEAFKRQHGEEPKFTFEHVEGESFIRNLERIL